MTTMMLRDAEDDLERAYRHYERLRVGLGDEMVDEFRRGAERILVHPDARQPLDATYRRYRLHRFPYGIVYRLDTAADLVVIVAFMHLSQKPGSWRRRE